MTCHLLSVLIPTGNSREVIEECLKSVRWADEVVVCDSLSTDGTLDIARCYADRIIQREYHNSASQKNWAIPQVSHEWVLIVDTDERVTDTLRQEIEAVLADPGETVGFRIPRANYVYGRQLRYGGEWPDFQLRLFRRDLGRYQEREVHAHVILDGPAGALASPFLHYPYRSLRDFRSKLLGRYTAWEALERHKNGVRFGWHKLIIRPTGAFLMRYMIRQGFRDSWQGLLMACVWAAYVFLTFLKLRELEKAGQR